MSFFRAGSKEKEAARIELRGANPGEEGSRRGRLKPSAASLPRLTLTPHVGRSPGLLDLFDEHSITYTYVRSKLYYEEGGGDVTVSKIR